MNKPTVLSIAGFDPSAGAGILADIKTFEAHQVYSFGVCSAITFQNDNEFENVAWIEVENIIKQIEVLFKRFKINWVKIGLIENVDVLKRIVAYLVMQNPDVRIIWDPILKASSGFVFHEKIDGNKLIDVCRDVFLITPNMEEIATLFPGMNKEKAGKELSRHCAVLLKGGHRTDGNPVDLLFYDDKQESFDGVRIDNDKHGTGCVLSAAILANLAMGKNLRDACWKAKQYINKFLESNSTLLGDHIYINE
ncbi:hydroxymethylpyrimidine/phosphomethylpyrimidine kinase [bacterium AH-315-M05]|nr:hydroxymethylpyrimidine/phosphomethylpyrimidine kinase [bacterium AH-315-M05]